jgi:presenilin-like A22 family membrane protease
MNEKKESIDVVPIFLMGGLFVLIDLLALVVTRPFEAAGVYAFVDPADPFNLAYFFLILLLFTAVILLISKFWKKQVVQAIILGSTGILCLYVFYPLLAVVVPETWSLGLSIAVTAILLILLVKYPEWYIVDISGVITGVGAIAILGISLSIVIVIVLLIGMSIYDAISVYKTKHMIDLADTLIDLKLPVLFVIPKIREYSLVKEKKSLKEKLKEDEKRDAFFIGMGDIIIPGILVASAFHNLPSNGLLIALSVMVGTLVGFALLMASVIKGKPQAGLPYLCPGAIIGYLVSSYLVFGGIVGFSMLI